MASIRKEFRLSTSPDLVWAAVEDVGAVHTRLAPGFVTGCRMDGPERIVTFANGLSARELIVDLDARARRIARTVQPPLGKSLPPLGDARRTRMQPFGNLLDAQAFAKAE